MKTFQIRLPDGLYTELAEITAQINEPGYGPKSWATDLIASELASRRLSRLSQPRPEPEPK